MNRLHPFRSLAIATVMCTLGLVVGCATDRQVIAQADQMHTTLKPAVKSSASRRSTC